MKTNLILITKTETAYQTVNELFVRTDYNLIKSQIGEVMQKSFMHSPLYLLVDLHDFNHQTLEIIKSVHDLTYIPVIYLALEERMEISSSLNGEIVLNYETFKMQYENLFKQAKLFKRQYDNVSEAFDTLDTMSTDTKSILRKYIDQAEPEPMLMYGNILNSFLKDNPVLSNKPQKIWIIKQNLHCTLFERNRESDEYTHDISFDLNEAMHFGFDIYAENGFKMNLFEKKYSDIDTSVELFPFTLKAHMDIVENFAGYGMDQVVVIGVNYNNSVTGYDASILKAATVMLDLLENIQVQINEVEEAFDYTLDALARAAEASDDSTGQHIRRVNEYARFIAEKLNLSDAFVKEIYKSAQMHDVGKIYVDNQILRKKGPLDDQEFEEMTRHTIYGKTIVGQSNYLKMASEIALNHHEKYDGSGYPNHISGDAIPLSARIVTLADVYDALRSPRSYKVGFSHEKAYDIIVNGDGRVMPSHFDPEILEIFKKYHLKFEEIFKRLSLEQI